MSPYKINIVMNVFDEEEDCEMTEVHKIIGFVLTERNFICPLILNDQAQLVPVFPKEVANFYFE